MKCKFPLLRFTAFSVLLACLGASISCVTTYDVYGRPVQTVDPAVAVAGIAAAGLIGYAAANNNNYYGGGYYGGGYYGGGPCYGGNNYGGYARGGYNHGGGHHSGNRPGY